MPKGFNKQFRKMLKDITKSSADRQRKAAAQAAASADRRRFAADRGGGYLGARSGRPERPDGSYQAGESDQPISSDSLPRPSATRAVGAAAAGAGVTGGVGGLTMATGSAPKLRKSGGKPPKPASAATPSSSASRGVGSSPGGWLSPLARGRPQTAQVRNSMSGGLYGQLGLDRVLDEVNKSKSRNVRVPVAYGKSTSGHDPHIWASAKRGDVTVTVEHTEYIDDIRMSADAVASANFDDCLTAIQINPGQDTVFAWLGAMAGLFETYEFQKLEFIYNPAVGTDQDGKILMTFDPDVADDPPASKQKMLEARIQMDTNPYLGFSLKVPRDVLTEERYTRRGDPPVNTDQRFYDVGTLYIATPGVPAGMQGELFVRYKVVFRTPNGGTALSGYGAANGETLATPLGNIDFQALSGTLAMQRYSGTSLYFNHIGTFKVTFVCAGTGFASNCGLTPSAPTAGVVIYGPSVGALGVFSATSCMSEFVITVYNNELWTFTVPSGAATFTSLRWAMSPWEPGVSST